MASDVSEADTVTVPAWLELDGMSYRFSRQFSFGRVITDLAYNHSDSGLTFWKTNNTNFNQGDALLSRFD